MSGTRSSTTFRAWSRSTRRLASPNCSTEPLASTTAPAQTIRSSGRSPMSSIQTICRGSSRHAGARCKRASHSTPSRACGARMARIDGFWSGRSWSTTTTARLAGTAFEPTSTTERSPRTRLRQSEAFLLEVQRLSRTGGWRYDLATDVVESSPEIQRAYAPQPGEDISRPAFWFERIHPEDRPRVQALFERCMREKTEYRAGYRIVLPDGSIRYQHATGHPVTNDAGDLVQFIGASMDMTEHWLATNELERASQAVRDLQARMSRAAQVATVGELAGSIAHEVNQPLAAVVDQRTRLPAMAVGVAAERSQGRRGCRTDRQGRQGRRRGRSTRTRLVQADGRRESAARPQRGHWRGASPARQLPGAQARVP